jgi:3-dehydroquinate synthase
VASVVSESLSIQSQKGAYSVFFDNRLLADAGRLLEGQPHFLIDANVARLYANQLRPILNHKNALVIEATEENKSIERIIPVFERLVENSVRRDHVLIAIGGGIIQDITCFVASTLLRGLSWIFVPTTLLAQADSCIGSKSSINLSTIKNILGTFNPPNEIHVCAGFLDTLENKDICSGIGEILKVHAIDSATAFDRVAADYDELLTDRGVLLAYIRKALLIKQRFIEEDEFDRGVRNIFNYGHSFGHAIEAATNFAVPHGIAVTLGMDMANRIASLRGLVEEKHYMRMHAVLRKNYAAFANTTVPLNRMLPALLKDKKNTSSNLVLILPVGAKATIQRVDVAPDKVFQGQCLLCLDEIKHEYH